MNSAILREFKIIDELLKLCEFPEQIKLRLLYRASIDGFSARSFHSKCDGFQKTLVIVKSEDFSVFGGYTEADWAGHGYATDFNAFIFSLINLENTPIKLKCVQPTNAIYRDANYGPTFGQDLYLCDNSNVNLSSYSNPGLSYSNGEPDAKYKSFAAEIYNFKTSEIEVFAIQNII